ncbi:Lar-like restriction alleviation protein [Vibrio phage D85]|nr:hypothetical protein PODOV033v1_p0053 [Vibrio phage 252E42.2]
MSNLKPCPFCNGEARISTEWDTDGFGNFHSVKCGKCGAESKPHFASSGNDCPQHYAEVREDWNQRHIPEELINAIEQEVVNSVSIMLKPHLAGVFEVIRLKMQEEGKRNEESN